MFEEERFIQSLFTVHPVVHECVVFTDIGIVLVEFLQDGTVVSQSI